MRNLFLGFGAWRGNATFGSGGIPVNVNRVKGQRVQAFRPGSPVIWFCKHRRDAVRIRNTRGITSLPAGEDGIKNLDYLLFTGMGSCDIHGMVTCAAPKPGHYRRQFHQHPWREGGTVGWAKVVPCPSLLVITAYAGRGSRAAKISLNIIDEG